MESRNIGSIKSHECINDVFVGIKCRRYYQITEIGYDNMAVGIGILGRAGIKCK